MLICEKEQTIIVADKSGDVHRFSIIMKEEAAAGKIVSTHSGGGKEINGADLSEETLVMGHVSMLLDLVSHNTPLLLLIGVRDACFPVIDTLDSCPKRKLYVLTADRLP